MLFRVEQKLKTGIPLQTEGEIDSVVEHLTIMIQSSAWKSTSKIIEDGNKHEDYIYSVKTAVIEKRSLQRIWMGTRALKNKTRLNAVIRKLKEHLQYVKKRIQSMSI